MSQNIIIFRNVVDSDYQSSIAGFKIVDTKLAKVCMKIIEDLMENNISFQVQDIQINYDIQKFDTFKVTSSDIHTLEKIFDFESQGSNLTFGVFPDILNDAYQNNLLSDQEFENLNQINENE